MDGLARRVGSLHFRVSLAVDDHRQGLQSASAGLPETGAGQPAGTARPPRLLRRARWRSQHQQDQQDQQDQHQHQKQRSSVVSVTTRGRVSTGPRAIKRR
jgi:hypothetical protein